MLIFNLRCFFHIMVIYTSTIIKTFWLAFFFCYEDFRVIFVAIAERSRYHHLNFFAFCFVLFSQNTKISHSKLQVKHREKKNTTTKTKLNQKKRGEKACLLNQILEIVLESSNKNLAMTSEDDQNIYNKKETKHKNRN